MSVCFDYSPFISKELNLAFIGSNADLDRIGDSSLDVVLSNTELFVSIIGGHERDRDP